MSMDPLRSHALAIFRAGLAAADPVAAMERHLARDGEVLLAGGEAFPLNRGAGVRVVGMGKASAAMAQPVEKLLGPLVREGAINVKYGHGRSLERIRMQEAGHPVPDPAGLAGTRAIVQVVQNAGPGELILCLLSGGGSALSPAPAPGLTLEDKQETTRALLASGAAIHEVNAVRKHLSTIKGGQLARLAFPAKVLAFLLSDVVGDDPATIASGPTVPDPTTFQDCLGLLERLRMDKAVPPAVLRHLEAGARGEVPETPKAGDAVFRNTRALVVGNNALALEAAREKARELGYRPVVLPAPVQGEAREVARSHAALAREIRQTGGTAAGPVCILAGGEPTVTVRGSGKGGRSQELALAAALEIQELEGVLVLAGGTDGTDGPTDAAGALADGATVKRARARGMEARRHLDDNDAYPFFQALGDLLVTGPTFTNVMDLHVVLVR